MKNSDTQGYETPVIVTHNQKRTDPMSQKKPLGEKLNKEASLTDVSDLLFALLEFIGALANLDTKFKAAAKLVGVMSRLATQAIDEECTRGESLETLPATSILAPEVRSLNLQLILSALRIRSFEMAPSDFLALLTTHHISGPEIGVCGMSVGEAQVLTSWLPANHWMTRIFDGATLVITKSESSWRCDVFVPNATRKNTGKIGIEIQASKDKQCEPNLELGSRHVDQTVKIVLEHVGNLKAMLARAGLSLSGRAKLEGFRLILSQSSDLSVIHTQIIVAGLNQ